jgi:hypothetical protein
MGIHEQIKVIVGERYGMLTVLSETESIFYGGNRHRRVICQCDCGKQMVVRISSLRYGSTKSCGCVVEQKRVFGCTKHGLNKHPVYKALNRMKGVCYNINHKDYRLYGARGIKICDEWKKDFMSFYNWSMIHGWEKGLTIDRINNDGNYTPSNCRWVSTLVQANNRRFLVKYNFYGERLTLPEICRRLNIYHKYSTIRGRINQSGMSLEQALVYNKEK